MKLIELTLEEKRELEGGWVKEIVSFIAAAIVDVWVQRHILQFSFELALGYLGLFQRFFIRII